MGGLKSIISGPPKPKPVPAPPPPAPIPEPDSKVDENVAEAEKKQRLAAVSRTGRASTILSDYGGNTNKLG